MPVITHDEEVDLGHNVRVQLYRFDGIPEGATWFHDCGDSPGKQDHIPINSAKGWKDGWDLTSEKPLTFSPSLLCRRCGFHGYIRVGQWVPV